MLQPDAGAPEPTGIRHRIAHRLGTRKRRRIAGIVALVLAPILLAGCQLPSFGQLRGGTTQAQDELKIWQGFFITGLVVGGIAIVLVIWAAFRYRRRKTTTGIPRQFQYQLPIEITYTVVPIIIVLVMFFFTVLTENNIDAVAKRPAVTVDVLAFQWGWKFTYPGHDVTVVGQTTQDPEMVVPYGQTVHINLRSNDVVHDFYVPQFNFDRFALPGVLNQFDLNIVRPGTYRGQCSELCGLYHALMWFRVKAVSPAAYQLWLSQEHGTTLTSATPPGHNLRAQRG